MLILHKLGAINTEYAKQLLEAKTIQAMLMLHIAEAIISALDTRRYGRYSVEQATARAVFLLGTAKVRVLLFDEIQHVVERNTETSWYEVADWLKNLSEALNLSLLFVGLPTAREMLSVNHQLRDWAISLYIIYPYNWNQPGDIHEFCRCCCHFPEKYQYFCIRPDMHNYFTLW